MERKLISVSLIALILFSIFASAVSIPLLEGIPEVTASPHSGITAFGITDISDVAASPSWWIVFDTGVGTYPSIMGNFDRRLETANGTLTADEFMDANDRGYDDQTHVIHLIYDSIMNGINEVAKKLFKMGVTEKGISISFYDEYDKDDFAQSNPMENAAIETYFVNNTSIFEATVAVCLTTGDEPMNNTNVSLKIGNSTFQKVLTANTNDLGYATFLFIGIGISAPNEYWYQAYITGKPNISTERRKINIREGYASQTLGDTVNKSVTLEKIEFIVNESLEGKPLFLKYIFSVTSKHTIDDNYTVTVRDYSGDITYRYVEQIRLEANTPKTVCVDIPIVNDSTELLNQTFDYTDLYRTYNVTFELQDYLFFAPIVFQVVSWILIITCTSASIYTVYKGIHDPTSQFGLSDEAVHHAITDLRGEAPPTIPEPNTLVITLITLLGLIGYAISIKNRSKK